MVVAQRRARERVKNERKCRDAEAEMKNARKRKAEMLPTAIRMLNSSHNNSNNKPAARRQPQREDEVHEVNKQ